MKIEVFLNDKPIEGTIMISYFSFERDHEIPAGQEEQYEREHHECPLLCHRDLIRIWSNDLIRRIEQKTGLWKGVTMIKFDNNLTTFGYQGVDDNGKVLIAKIIPLSNLVELNIYSNLTNDVIAEQAKRKNSLSKKEAEGLR